MQQPGFGKRTRIRADPAEYRGHDRAHEQESQDHIAPGHAAEHAAPAMVQDVPNASRMAGCYPVNGASPGTCRFSKEGIKALDDNRAFVPVPRNKRV